MKKNQTVFLGVVSLVGMSILNTGCGAQAFNVMPSQANIAAPGGAVVPPKVDILLVEDDTGSITPAFPTITSAVKDFLNQLDQQPWDYHFATIPLTTYRPIQQVVGSKYDSNRGSTWTPAYPGQKPNDLDMLPESFFSLPKDFSGFL